MSDAPLILFGAFDRHSFGDLLLGEIAAARICDRPVIFAGLAKRDLRPFGGRCVVSLASPARVWADQPADVLVEPANLACGMDSLLHQAGSRFQAQGQRLARLALEAMGQG
ncbi:MAG: hypothetical protein WBP72_08650 [Rhodocyclaceae bacterium]